MTFSGGVPERRVEEARMFTFTTSSSVPCARVRCHNCAWSASGNDPRKVFPKADEHCCSSAGEALIEQKKGPGWRADGTFTYGAGADGRDAGVVAEERERR